MVSNINTSMANPFENIRTAAGDIDRSAQWYQAAIRKYLEGVNTYAEVLKTDIGEITNKLEVGSMYMFRYDPRHKETLKYYDGFPLVMISEPLPNGFSGINLHYLAPLKRAELLGQLMPQNKQDFQITKQDKLASDWRIVQNFTRFPGARNSIKKYLSNQIQGRLLKVDPEHWKAAIFLPVQNFTGASDRTVWRHSNKIPERKRSTI